MADLSFLKFHERELIREGHHVEAGWISLRIAIDGLDLPPAEIQRMRDVFFGGASFLFSSVMTALDPARQPTQIDVERIAAIARELRSFQTDKELRGCATAGSA